MPNGEGVKSLTIMYEKCNFGSLVNVFDVFFEKWLRAANEYMSLPLSGCY